MAGRASSAPDASWGDGARSATRVWRELSFSVIFAGERTLCDLNILKLTEIYSLAKHIVCFVNCFMCT